MTHTNGIRAAYLAHVGIHPDSIPGRACLRGDYDSAPGMATFAEQHAGGKK